MTTFAALSDRRRAYVEAARDNGFEEGLRTLLANLYPDNAHFIYEILQNAEDAGAREVNFHLQTDGLRVEHDGTRLFNLRDIDSITGIGQSTKADDVTSIGKFGVGFKAVFAYTKTPTIHSGEHSFAIHDLFVPVVVPVPASARHGRTSFWFPFDRPDKPADRASTEVATALRDLSRTTLLFLKNIRLIACTFPDGDERLLERRSLDEHVIAIESLHEEGGPQFWYRIGGHVDIQGKPLPVAAAFALEPLASKQTEVNRYSITPIDGQVFIYFPAVNETSGLKFHMHAPFASTVARDSVRDDPGNEALIQGLAEVIAEALPTMREAGLITDGLLSALPNDNDELPRNYAPIRQQVTASFDNESLTPMVGGGFAPALALLRSESKVRSALSLEDANFLHGLSAEVEQSLATGWLQSGRNRASAFLNSLSSVDFGRDELSEALERVATVHRYSSTFGDDFIDGEDRSVISSWDYWISGKSNNWLREFYIALESLVPPSRQHSRLSYLGGDELVQHFSAAPLIRVQEGEGVRHVPSSEAYLPTAPGLRADRLVVDALAPFDSEDDSENDDGRRELRAFYDLTNVRVWDVAARLDTKFSAYADEPATVTEQHLEDLSKLASLLDQETVAPRNYQNRPILAALRKDGSIFWAAPSEIYLDEPFIATGLTSLYQSDDYLGTPLAQLSPEYVGKTPDVVSLAQRLGITSELHVAQVPAWNNPRFERRWRFMGRENSNMISQDWQVPQFDLIVSTGDEQLLRLLWQVIVSADLRSAEAMYRLNASSSLRRFPSQLLQNLSTEPWILDRDGNLRLPADMTAEELPQGLLIPAKAPLLELAGFGQKAAAQATHREADEERAKELGFESADELRTIAEVYQEYPEEFREWLHERKMRSLPEAPSLAPEQRAKRTGELSASATRREYDKRIRSVYVQVPGHRSAARGYLTQIYTNDDGIMVCQICSAAMPFKVEGSYYFEAVQFLSDSKRDLRENRLALCPTCAAKYRHACETNLGDLRDDLLTQSVGHLGSISVDVVLAGEAASVRFGGKHAIDLQAALNATEDTQVEESPDPADVAAAGFIDPVT